MTKNPDPGSLRSRVLLGDQTLSCGVVKSPREAVKRPLSMTGLQINFAWVIWLGPGFISCSQMAPYGCCIHNDRGNTTPNKKDLVKQWDAESSSSLCRAWVMCPLSRACYVRNTDRFGTSLSVRIHWIRSWVMLILLFAAFQVVLIFLNSWLLANIGSIISIINSVLINCQLLYRKCICLVI